MAEAQGGAGPELVELEVAVEADDPERLDRAVRGVVEKVAGAEPGAATAMARQGLDVLRRRRQFRPMLRVAEGAFRAGVEDATVFRLYAQALIEEGLLGAALAVLHDLRERPGDEAPEIQGLIGRAHKQRYLDGPTSTGAERELRAAIDAYLQPFTDSPDEHLWHGINAVALLARAERDAPDWRAMAGRITSTLCSRPAGSSQVWDAAIAAEAHVALRGFRRRRRPAVRLHPRRPGRRLRHRQHPAPAPPGVATRREGPGPAGAGGSAGGPAAQGGRGPDRPRGRCRAAPAPARGGRFAPRGGAGRGRVQDHPVVQGRAGGGSERGADRAAPGHDRRHRVRPSRGGAAPVVGRPVGGGDELPRGQPPGGPARTLARRPAGGVRGQRRRGADPRHPVGIAGRGRGHEPPGVARRHRPGARLAPRPGPVLPGVPRTAAGGGQAGVRDRIPARPGPRLLSPGQQGGGGDRCVAPLPGAHPSRQLGEPGVRRGVAGRGHPPRRSPQPGPARRSQRPGTRPTRGCSSPPSASRWRPRSAEPGPRPEPPRRSGGPVGAP